MSKSRKAQRKEKERLRQERLKQMLLDFVELLDISENVTYDHIGDFLRLEDGYMGYEGQIRDVTEEYKEEHKCDEDDEDKRYWQLIITDPFDGETSVDIIEDTEEEAKELFRQHVIKEALDFLKIRLEV